jgi:hypothetical protein
LNSVTTLQKTNMHVAAIELSLRDAVAAVADTSGKERLRHSLMNMARQRAEITDAEFAILVEFVVSRDRCRPSFRVGGYLAADSTASPPKMPSVLSIP